MGIPNALATPPKLKRRTRPISGKIFTLLTYSRQFCYNKEALQGNYFFTRLEAPKGYVVHVVFPALLH